MRIPIFDRHPSIFYRFTGKTDTDGGGPEAGEPLPAPFSRNRLVRIRQVHGARVLAVTAGAPIPAPGTEADGAVTDRPGLLLRVSVADCLPVFIVDASGSAVALVHAGWRGLAAGVIEEAIRVLGERGSRPPMLVAAIGPSIGPCCYEVGEEVAVSLGEGAAPRPGPRGRRHVDLFGSARARLLAMGVPEAAIGARPLCTSCHSDLYHSHRGSGGDPGRNEALLGISGA